MNKNNLEKNERLTKVVKGLAYTGIATACAMYCVEIAYGNLDIDKMVDGSTSPAIKGIKDHWGKVLMIVGAPCTLLGEGDGIQRAKRALYGCCAGAFVMLGMIAGFG